MVYEGWNGYSNYNALNIKLQRRAKDLTLLAAYAWSKMMDVKSAAAAVSGDAFGAYGPQNSHCIPCDYARSSYDVGQRFVSSFLYNLPFGQGQRFGGGATGAMNALIGGWQFNGILTLRTGDAYTMSGTNCHGVWSHCMPDYASGFAGSGNAAPAGGRSTAEWFNTANYVVAASNQATGLATGGDVGLQTLTGPPTETMDFSIFKGFRFTERVGLQFRGEALNLGNFAVLNNPDASLGDAKIYGGNGNFGTITGAAVGTERHIQFSLRLTF
jgi:hypothetical protein